MAEHFDVRKEEELTEEQKQAKQKRGEKEVVDRIIRGVNDTFVKEYEYKDLGINYTIKIKAPNAVQIGKIQAHVSMYLGGMNNYASEYVIVAYQALATLRVVGIDVPEELADDENIFNLQPLYEIGRDFQQWLNNFRF